MAIIQWVAGYAGRSVSLSKIFCINAFSTKIVIVYELEAS